MTLKDYRVPSRACPKAKSWQAMAWKAHSPRLLYNNTVGRCSVTDLRCKPSECRAIMRLLAFYSNQVRLTRFARNPVSWLAGSQVMTQSTWRPAFPKLAHGDEIVNIFALCWEIILYIVHQKYWIWTLWIYTSLWRTILILYVIYTTINRPSVGTGPWQKPRVKSKQILLSNMTRPMPGKALYTHLLDYTDLPDCHIPPTPARHKKGWVDMMTRQYLEIRDILKYTKSPLH